MRQQVILAIVVSVALTAACSGSDEPEMESLSFTVDSTLLGEKLTDSVSGLRLSAPVDWRRQTDETVQQVQAGIAASQAMKGRPLPEILALFSGEEQSAHLIVARYDAGLSPADQDSIVRWQRNSLETQFPNAKISSTTFLHNELPIEQLLMVGDEFAVIKLFIRRKGRGMHQIEYVVRRSRYEAALRSIESSIGSISFGS